MIVSPGFIDTHHHVWQTQLKGRHANQTLLEYLPNGPFIDPIFNTDVLSWLISR
jgi:cytosine/adenosine deaminase-related metal-dependent hydrolase